LIFFCSRLLYYKALIHITGIWPLN
jgi:hypothetical protein